MPEPRRRRIRKKPSNHGRFLWLSGLLLIPVMVFGFLYYDNDTTEPQPLTSQVNVATQTEVADNMKQTPNNVQPCTTPPTSSRIEIDISEQKLHLFCDYSDHQEKKIYSISTSKYGIGNKAGSDKTPLGLHYIENKIGEGAPKGMIFKARRATGQIAEMNVPGAGDLVTTRIMWLKGLEPGMNSGQGIDSYQRYIYIHGTAEENKIGQPASHGCVRMYNRDVIDLFKRVGEGTEVLITE